MPAANSTANAKSAPIDRRSQWLRLGIAVGVMALIWLVVLPRLGETPPIKRHIETMKAAGIDPSAMFYTELEPHLFLQPQK